MSKQKSSFREDMVYGPSSDPVMDRVVDYAREHQQEGSKSLARKAAKDAQSRYNSSRKRGRR